MSSPNEVLQMIKTNGVKFVDLRFTDPRGKWQHVSYDLSLVDTDFLTNGTMFDGSSISGWRAINESDMTLVPDCSTAALDPFFSQPTLVLICDTVEPTTGELYNRDPRAIAKRAEKYLQSSGIADTAYFGPEAEFFVFDDVRWATDQQVMSYSIDSSEMPSNTNTHYENGNLGHRVAQKSGYFPVPPVDAAQDMRGEMLSVLEAFGCHPEKHHHEVAPAQHELGMKFANLVTMADRMQIFKYVVHQVAQAYGKTATFMPKPMWNDNGSGMHCHQSLWKNGQPLFAGSGYAGLSDTCLYYIGGIIRHAKAINALSNPTTNSYKRLVPGFEAPVLLAYSARNRSASCRIPYGEGPKTKRIEVRFPDPLANPYLAFTALLMAGLDGIERKLDPGEPIDKDLYELPPEELKDVPTVCGSLREAVTFLDTDRNFLKKGGVMDDDFIDSYIELKIKEIQRFEMAPHPVEFDMYYSAG